ncbi:MAG TPA: nitroreductase family protein [Ktedonobacterales bacterium]
MDTVKAIQTVLAVRKFKDTPLPREVVRGIVEAGRLTASSINGQPWHFVVVQDKNTLQQLGQLAKTGPYIAQAPMAIAVCMLQSRYALSDCSRAIQDMVLAAWDMGVGSNWVGFNNLADVKPLLGIPQDVDVLAILPFGYPAEQIGAGIKKRKSLGEVASSERYGQPFS